MLSTASSSTRPARYPYHLIPLRTNYMNSSHHHHVVLDLKKNHAIINTVTVVSKLSTFFFSEFTQIQEYRKSPRCVPAWVTKYLVRDFVFRNFCFLEELYVLVTFRGIGTIASYSSRNSENKK